ncbi:MAG: delta-60 repeat domain-containing protein [Terrimicrobiaceae bacterium]
MNFFIIPLCLLLVAQVLPAQDSAAFGRGEGVNGKVLALVAQPDGKVIIGGAFSAVNGVPRQNLARLNPDGTLDAGFISQAVEGPNGPVAALLLFPDGSVLAGGDFTTAGNLVRSDLAKFKADGTADAQFGSLEGGVATNGSVAALILQPDGSIVVGGNFTTFYGQPRRSIARLNADGSVAKASRELETMNGSVNALGVDSQGSVIAGGAFSDPGQNARSILRLSR